jgi:hypothetical protein
MGEPFCRAIILLRALQQMSFRTVRFADLTIDIDAHSMSTFVDRVPGVPIPSDDNRRR